MKAANGGIKWHHENNRKSGNGGISDNQQRRARHQQQWRSIRIVARGIIGGGVSKHQRK